MERFLIFIGSLLILCLTSFGQIVQSKEVDNGGSGLYKALAVTEKSLPDFVVYRPEKIKSCKKGR